MYKTIRSRGLHHQRVRITDIPDGVIHSPNIDHGDQAASRIWIWNPWGQ